MNWIQNKVSISYNSYSYYRLMFAQNNLCFLNPKDIPCAALAQLASGMIREEMLSAKWGKLLHEFTNTHAVRVCQGGQLLERP